MRTPREQENELREKLGRFMYENYFFFQHLGCSGECNHKKHAESSLDELVALIKQDREAYATQVKANLAKDLDNYTAEHDQPFVQWTRDWLDAHAQQETTE